MQCDNLHCVLASLENSWLSLKKSTGTSKTRIDELGDSNEGTMTERTQVLQARFTQREARTVQRSTFEVDTKLGTSTMLEKRKLRGLRFQVQSPCRAAGRGTCRRTGEAREARRTTSATQFSHT